MFVTSLAERLYGAKLSCDVDCCATPLEILKRDPVLAGLIRRYPLQILPPAAKTLFEPLVKTVIQQQVRFSVAQVIIERMQAHG